MSTTEAPLLADWIEGYQFAMACFPKLHVIVPEEKMEHARSVFSAVPNTTIHPNGYPPLIEKGGTFVFMQWPMMWVDNITSAPFIFTWDVDSVPVLLRGCQGVTS